MLFDLEYNFRNSPTRCVSQPANLSFASPHVKPTSIKKSASIDRQSSLKVCIPERQTATQTFLLASNSEGYSTCRERGLKTNPGDKTLAMFSLAPAEWEENFQDLSDWCAPSARHDPAHRYAAPTDELNTPIIALETEGFHFNPNLARREPKFVIDSNQWDVTPSEEREPSSYNSADIVPDNVVEPYSPSNISPCSITSNTTMAWDDGEYGFHERNTNVFITDLHQEDYMKSECSAPLAVVEGKIGEDDFNAGLITNGDEINTPDIVRMIIDFPVRNEKSMGLMQINVNRGTNTACDGLGTPVDELLLPENEGEFDLLAYIDDSPKVSPTKNPAEKRVESLQQKENEHSPCVPKLQTASKIIDLHSNDYVALQSEPQSSKIMPHKSVKSVVIKEEISSEEEVDEEDETYKPYKQTKSRKRGRKATKKELEFVTPSKRSRRSTSTCSEMTTASTSSDSKYRELRDRNNEASKRSRQSRKMRDGEMMIECSRMEKENSALKARADEMERLVKQLRQALLTAVAKKK